MVRPRAQADGGRGPDRLPQRRQEHELARAGARPGGPVRIGTRESPWLGGWPRRGRNGRRWRSGGSPASTGRGAPGGRSWWGRPGTRASPRAHGPSPGSGRARPVHRARAGPRARRRPDCSSRSTAPGLSTGPTRAWSRPKGAVVSSCSSTGRRIYVVGELGGGAERPAQRPVARASSVRRFDSPVLEKIAFRWSWTVCSERKMRSAVWRVSVPVAR